MLSPMLDEMGNPIIQSIYDIDDLNYQNTGIDWEKIERERDYTPLEEED